ncbi:MAG: hypothetical protein Athens071426_621 [Parcubacteria group bacterium Athens0714_26]|nr:MAG: hypothetical protein Athens101426_604 [Parcubacteria group bacterium Athens1014_26]TSD01894.1 MAG: hypothetical protein Athens071426_621 [Parcubacteria group bacterium Athens0714_26]
MGRRKVSGEGVLDVYAAMEKNRNKFLNMREPVIHETSAISVSFGRVKMVNGEFEPRGGRMKVTRVSDASEVSPYNLVEPGEELLELSNEF